MQNNPASGTRLLLHVEGDSGERKRVAGLLAESVGAMDLHQFATPRELPEFLQGRATEARPWLVILPADDASSVPVALSWLKRHPVHHFTPVLLLGEAHGQASEMSRGLLGSVMGTLERRPSAEALRPLLERGVKLGFRGVEEAELERLFQEELTARIGQCREFFGNLNEQNVRRLYHAFHTIKGSASALEYPAISVLMHAAEGWVGVLQRSGNIADPEIGGYLRGCLQFLDGAVESLRARVVHELPSSELLAEAGKAGALRGGGRIAPEPRPLTGADNLGVTEPAPPLRAKEVRIPTEKLDEVETRFRKILSLKVRMSRFANQLKSEFNDERFPDDLRGMVDELQQEMGEVLEFLVGLRLTPLVRLRAFAEKVTRETGRQLQKPAELEFSCPAVLAVEPRIFECLENAVLHLVRNAIDHGIESQELRQRGGKEPAGRIRLELREFGADKIMAVLEDDGSGIDIEALTRAVMARGILAASVLERMKPLEIAQLVFSEDLSTKAEANQVSGRGIGLSIVKAQISEFGGMIEVYFEKGKGSRFTLVLPRIFQHEKEHPHS